jgi:hypothetical protein
MVGTTKKEEEEIRTGLIVSTLSKSVAFNEWCIPHTLLERVEAEHVEYK